MTAKQMTTALSNVSVSGPPAKLPNFPLPRELRDKIYGYLLDSDYTRLRRTVNQNQEKTQFERVAREEMAYHFHTNILAVNRAIHEEAESYSTSVISLSWSVTSGHTCSTRPVAGSGYSLFPKSTSPE